MGRRRWALGSDATARIHRGADPHRRIKTMPTLRNSTKRRDHRIPPGSTVLERPTPAPSKRRAPSSAPSIAGLEGQGPQGTGQGRPVRASGDRMSTLACPLEAEKRRAPGTARRAAPGARPGGSFLLPTFLWTSKEKPVARQCETRSHQHPHRTSHKPKPRTNASAEPEQATNTTRMPATATRAGHPARCRTTPTPTHTRTANPT